MAKIVKIFLYLLTVIQIVDLYINYNAKDFPEYHEKRVKFNICSLLIILMPLLLLIFIFCGPCGVYFCLIFSIVISFAGIYYEISSFYLYFAYDGSNKIKSPVIRIFMWISLFIFFANLFSNGRICSSSTKKESDNIEMEEQNV